MRVSPKSQTSPKKHDQKKGIWVYGIRSHPGAPIHAKGIQPGTRVYTLPFNKREIVVSNVDLHTFSGPHLLQQLEKDITWAQKSVMLHHAIITKAGKRGVVIPMKFGTVFKTKKNVEKEMRKYEKTFTNLFSYLADKEEWGVKAYIDRRKFTTGLKEKEKKFIQFEKKRNKVPAGIAWYIEKKIDERIAQKHDNEIERYSRKIIKGLERYAEKMVINDILPVRTSEGREMTLNSAWLVKKKSTSLFKRKIKEVFEKYTKKGIVLEASGPWPPYNFVTLPVLGRS